MAPKKPAKTPPRGEPAAPSSRPRGATPTPPPPHFQDLTNRAYIAKKGAKTFHIGAKCPCGLTAAEAVPVGSERGALRRGLKPCPKATP